MQEAYYIFQELNDKYGVTALLLNSQSVCYIGQGEYTKAETTLQEALEKDSNDIDSLVNSLFISGHLKVPAEVIVIVFDLIFLFCNCRIFFCFIQVVKRNLNMLQDTYARSDFVLNYKSKEKEFDLLANSFQ